MRLEPVRGYIITVFALMPLAVAAQSSHPVAERANYVPAKVIKKYAPYYPEREAASKREGWVVLSYIVSTSGHVKDVMIEDSTGDKAFERAATRAVKTWLYRPAMLNGKPVQQSMVHTRVTFQFQGAPKGARPSFTSAFVRVKKAIRAGKLDEAEKMLNAPELTDRENLYEDAWFWWLKYEYLLVSGHSTRDQLMDCLQKAIRYQEIRRPEVDHDYLQPEIFVAAAQQLFVLQARTLDLSGAIRTFSALSSSKSAREAHAYSAVMKQLEPAYKKIGSIISGDRILEMRARVGEFGDWVHQLVRRSFSVGKINGHLAALEVRCKRGTEAFDVSRTSKSRYLVPQNWGDCSVYVKGDKGTTFALYQYPTKAATRGNRRLDGGGS